MKEEKDHPNRPADLRKQAEEIAQEKAVQIPESLFNRLAEDETAPPASTEAPA